MNKNKRFEYSDVWGWNIDGFLNVMNGLDRKNNELKERIKELEKEKQDLKDKAKILVDYYSRRYANAIFNNRKYSKQFKSDLWSVKEVLYVLDLHDGDIDG